MTIHHQLRWMRRYMIVVWNHNLAYRGELFFILIAGIIRTLIGLAIWLAAIEAGATLPRDRAWFTTYFLMLPVVEVLTSSYLAEPLAYEIRSGRLATTLIVPGKHRFRWLLGKLALNAVDGMLLLSLIATVTIIFRNDIGLPTAPGRWAAFLASMALTSALTLALEALFGTLAFWLEDIGSVLRGNAVLATVLGGQLVPLALMPAWSHAFLVAQPYRSMVSFPLEIISGDLDSRDLAIGFGLQMLWISVITWGAFTLWRRGLKGYTVFNV